MGLILQNACTLQLTLKATGSAYAEAKRVLKTLQETLCTWQYWFPSPQTAMFASTYNSYLQRSERVDRDRAGIQ